MMKKIFASLVKQDSHLLLEWVIRTLFEEDC